MEEEWDKIFELHNNRMKINANMVEDTKRIDFFGANQKVTATCQVLNYKGKEKE